MTSSIGWSSCGERIEAYVVIQGKQSVHAHLERAVYDCTQWKKGCAEVCKAPSGATVIGELISVKQNNACDT